MSTKIEHKWRQEQAAEVETRRMRRCSAGRRCRDDGSCRNRRGDSRFSRGKWRRTKHVDVDFLACLTVAGDTTYEEVVAVSGDGDGVVACGVSRDWRRRIAVLVLRVDHLHHIVELRVVLKNCAVRIRISQLIHHYAKKDDTFCLSQKQNKLFFWSSNYLYTWSQSLLRPAPLVENQFIVWVMKILNIQNAAIILFFF